VSRANQRILAELNQDPRSELIGRATNAAIEAIKDATPKVATARDLLLSFLSSEGVPASSGT
jgi:hypothetical protein